MRNVLFRIKDFDEWYYGCPMSEIKNGTVAFAGKSAKDGSSYYNLLAEAKTLGEYTGLTDRTGNKIFEGDIVTSRMSSSKYQVVWEECQFKIKDKWGNIYTPKQEFLTHIEVEIIGNIHDNPELLANNNDNP